MDNNVQFLQGIYIHGGGANVATTKAFLESLENTKYSVDYVEMFPDHENPIIRRSLIFLLAFPFAMLKGKLCILEYFYKISLYSMIRFVFTRKNTCIFNHHATFYLAPIAKILGQRIIFIVHDSVYLKACRSKEWRIFLFITKIFERWIFRFADCVLFVSDSEREFCERAYKLENVNLVNIMSRSEIFKIEHLPQENDFCIIGDWRRKENIDGLKKFLESDYKILTEGENIKIFGLGLQALDLQISPDVTLCGEYKSLSSLPYKKFIVPIWKGAGVKRKVLELLFSERTVYGTDVAFDGLPSGLATGKSIKFHIKDGFLETEVDNSSENSIFSTAYFSRAKDLGELIS